MKRIGLLLVVLLFMLSLSAQNEMKVVDSLRLQSVTHFNNHDYQSSLKDIEQYTDIIRKLHGEDNNDYASAMKNACACYFFLNDSVNAMRAVDKAFAIYRKIKAVQTKDYLEAVDFLSNVYQQYKNIPAAIQLKIEALPIYRAVYGEKSKEVGNVLFEILNLSLVQNDRTTAVEYGRKIIEGAYFDVGEQQYSVTLLSLSTTCFAQQNYEECVKWGEKYLKLCRGKGMTNDAVYTTIHRTVMMSYSQMLDYHKALNYCREEYEQAVQQKGIGSQEYLLAQSMMIKYLSVLGERDEAVQRMAELAQALDSVTDKENASYVISLISLATNYQEMDENQKAISIGTKAYDIAGRMLKKNNKDHNNKIVYAGVAQVLAKCYKNIGDIFHAAYYNSSAKVILWTDSVNDPVSYAKSLELDAKFCYDVSNYERAVEKQEKALDIIVRAEGTRSIDYIQAVNDLAIYYMNVDRNQDALRLFGKVLDMSDEAYGKSGLNSENVRGNMAKSYFNLGNLNKAIEIQDDLVGKYAKKVDSSHGDYIDALGELTFFCFMAHKYKQMAQRAHETFRLTEKKCQSYFSTMTADERHIVWGLYGNFITNLMSQYTYRAKDDTLVADLYDCQLLGKNVLLNAEIGLQNLILESGNNSLIDKFRELQSNRAKFNKFDNMPVEERKLNGRYVYTKDIADTIAAEEKELVAMSKAVGDFTKGMNIHWRDVKAHLRDSDAAIEFVDFNVYPTDSIVYAALLLRKNMKSPKMITLFSDKELERIAEKDYYTTDALSNLVWAPLERWLHGVKNVFFSPSGKLHQMAIEYLPMKDGLNIVDHYHLYRLSSTREIVLNHRPVSRPGAALFGGLEYELGAKDWENVRLQLAADTTNVASRDVNIAELRSMRSGLTYLEGTEREVENIDKQLNQKKAFR
jgi:hypothetical protein